MGISEKVFNIIREMLFERDEFFFENKILETFGGNSGQGMGVNGTMPFDE